MDNKKLIEYKPLQYCQSFDEFFKETLKYIESYNFNKIFSIYSGYFHFENQPKSFKFYTGILLKKLYFDGKLEILDLNERPSEDDLLKLSYESFSNLKFFKYKKILDIKFNKGVFTFEYVDKEKFKNRGKLKITLHKNRTSYYFIDTKIKSVHTFFNNTTVLKTENSTSWCVKKETLFFDFYKFGGVLEFICKHSARIDNFIGKNYNNFGYYYKHLHEFENNYNFEIQGVKSHKFIDINVNDMPKDIRKILNKNKCKISNTLNENLVSKPELVFTIIRKFDEEHLPIRMNLHPNYNQANLVLSEVLSSVNMFVLITRFNYDFIALLRYSLNYSMPYENFAFSKTLSMLRDYANMNFEVGNLNYKKYPKFLKSRHDIIKVEFDMIEDKVDVEKFKENVEFIYDYLHPSFKFVVFAPRTVDDLKEEGKKLIHCVGSYVKRIIRKESSVYFLRTIENESLVTLEIRNGCLVQARGFDNQKPTIKQLRFIEQFCNAKKLKMRI